MRLLLLNYLHPNFSKMMSFLLIICITLVSFSMNFSPAFQSHFTYGNETDRLALLEFKRMFTIRLMYYGYYPEEALVSWSNHSDHCKWTGIKCNRQHPRRVTVLDLSRQELGFYSRVSIYVTIPPEIGNLTFLTTLRLGNIYLSGEIPQEIGRLVRLQYLDLSNNQLSGGFPKDIGSLFWLQYLDLSYNQLCGGIPQEIGGLARLQYLNLSYNRLSGEIPSSLKNCLDLKRLNLRVNNLQGRIPSSLQSLKGIQELILESNQLSGPIPEYLESFHSLNKLGLSWNKFQGQVPNEGIFKNTSAFSWHGNSELCGGNALLQLPSCPKIVSKKSGPGPFLILFGVVISVMIILGSCLEFHSWRKVINQSSEEETPLLDMFPKVSYRELLKSTDGFSEKNLVGVGGYGSVYIGILMLSQEVTSVVAVKVLDLQRRGALKSFKAECEAWKCTRHRNVMKILTACSSIDSKGNEFKALVYEYMPNGSPENWLHPTSNNGQHQKSTNRPLKFLERLNIAIDVAFALDYLHRQCQTPIAHCDLKPSNILLDEDMNGHLGDFGSAKFLHGVIVNAESGSRCSTSLIRGSIGYVAPEYGLGRAVSTNGDFYSFGIMLLELFTGRRPTSETFKDGRSLHNVAKTALNTCGVMQIVDASLIPIPRRGATYEEVIINGTKKAKLCEALTEIFELGVACSTESPKERMEMMMVVKELQSIKNACVS